MINKKIFRQALVSCLIFAGSSNLSLANAQTGFDNVEIKKVVDSISKLTGKPFTFDKRVKGKIDFVSPEEFNGDNEALYDTLQAVLGAHGYTAVKAGGVYKVIPTLNVRTQIPASSANGANDWATEVISVSNLPATKLVAVMRPLIAKEGHLVAIEAGNKLIITDTKSNIERIRGLLERVDIDARDGYEVIALKKASVKDVVGTVGKLMDPKDMVKASVNVRANQIILTGPKSKRLFYRMLIADLDSSSPESSDVHVAYLRYAKAKDLIPILNKLVSTVSSNAKGQGTKAMIQADERMNAIVIKASRNDVSAIKQVIEKLDVRRAQVLIEAVFVEVNESKASELGVDWVTNGTKGAGIINFSNGIPALLSGDPAIQVSALGRGLGIGIGDVNSNGHGWGALLRALKSDSNSNVLATPSLMTLDNEEAEIVVGKEVPFQTGSYTSASNSVSNPFSTIERKNVGLKLKVKPQINEGDEVFLEIEQEVSDVLPKDEAVDIQTTTRKIKTKVIIGDGNVIVLGGLTNERDTQVNSKVPGLGDIPGVGELFSSKSIEREKVNLMVFLRPVIVRDNVVNDKQSQQKYSLMQNKISMTGFVNSPLPGYQSYKENGLQPSLMKPVESKDDVQGDFFDSEDDFDILELD